MDLHDSEFQEKKDLYEKALNKSINNAEKKRLSLQFALEQCLKWPEVHHEGLLLQANLYRWTEGAPFLEVQDWENNNQNRTIVFTEDKTRQQHIKERFNTSKRQCLAILKIEKELKETIVRKMALESTLASLHAIQTLEALEVFGKEIFTKQNKTQRPSKKIQKALPYREFYSECGFQIWVGKKNRDNETLTFKLANGSDYWLHADGFAGSHVVIKCPKGKEPDEKSILEAARLALYYSKGKDQGQGDVIVTQCKYVKRFGKGPQNCGKVQISKHRKVSVKLN